MTVTESDTLPLAAGFPGEEQHGKTHLIFGSFRLGTEEYAIPIDGLSEVVDEPARLQSMPLSPEYLAGVFAHRGKIIPVIDLRVLLRMAPAEDSASGTRRLAILKRGSARIALLFDSLGEVLRIRPDQLTPFHYEDEARSIPVEAVIYNEQRETMVQVLDLPALFTVRNLPLHHAGNGSDGGEAKSPLRQKRSKYVVFTIGPTVLALPIDRIQHLARRENVKRALRRTDLSEATLEWNGNLVPLVRTSRLLKLEGSPEPPLVLICQIEHSLIGFEFDELRSIASATRDEVVTVPILEDHRTSVIAGSITEADGTCIMVLNADGMLTRPEVSELSTSHHRLHQQGLSLAQREQGGKRLTEPVLTFRIGKLYGLPLKEVCEIVPSLDTLTRMPDTPPAFLGMINLRGRGIPVVDPRVLFEIDAPAAEAPPKVLIFEVGTRRIGLRIDALCDIKKIDRDKNQALPDFFFLDEQQRFQNGFAGGLGIEEPSGDKTAVVLLNAPRIVERLTQALDAWL